MTENNTNKISIFFTDDFKFQYIFQNYLNIAFTVWGILCPDIAEKLKNKNYKDLTTSIRQLELDTAKKHGNDLIGFLSKNNLKILQTSDWLNDIWTPSNIQTSEENKLFLIGESFILIENLWQQLSGINPLKTQRDRNQFFMRTSTLRGIIDDLSMICVNNEHAKLGGQKTNSIRERCKLIIQTPEYNITSIKAKTHLTDTIQRIKNIYFKKYGESLQKPNKKGNTTPCDKTITNWLYEFSNHDLPAKRA